jgi:hypothetical protein
LELLIIHSYLNIWFYIDEDIGLLCLVKPN